MAKGINAGPEALAAGKICLHALALKRNGKKIPKIELIWPHENSPEDLRG